MFNRAPTVSHAMLVAIPVQGQPTTSAPPAPTEASFPPTTAGWSALPRPFPIPPLTNVILATGPVLSASDPLSTTAPAAYREWSSTTSPAPSHAPQGIPSINGMCALRSGLRES